MREILTSLLDAVGLLLVAAGLGALAYRWVGWAALAISGVTVLVGSAFATWQTRPPKKDGGVL